MTKNNYIKRALFRLGWLAMSDRERYAYLWRQTRESIYNEHKLHSKVCLSVEADGRYSI